MVYLSTDSHPLKFPCTGYNICYYTYKHVDDFSQLMTVTIFRHTFASWSLGGSFPPSSSGKMSTSKCLWSDCNDEPWKCS